MKFDYTEKQHERILNYFHNVSPRLTVSEGRSILGVLHLAGRIKELRENGWSISTYWITYTDKHGINHRIGRYIFHGRKKQGAKNDR